MLRELIGFLIAPGLPALALYFINLSVVSPHEAFLLAYILTIFGYVAAIIFGAPVHYILKKRRLQTLRVYVASGALIGLSFYALFFLTWALLSYQSYPDHSIALLQNSAMTGVVAVAYATFASAIFWLLAVRKRST
jgi:hypothetical protein